MNAMHQRHEHHERCTVWGYDRDGDKWYVYPIYDPTDAKTICRGIDTQEEAAYITRLHNDHGAICDGRR